MKSENNYNKDEIDLVIQMLKEDLQLAVTKEEQSELRAQIKFFKQERYA